MVKITNIHGDIKVGKQGAVCYQRYYGRQMRRLVKPKQTESSLMQNRQRTRFQEALSWRATLSLPARRYLEGYCIHHGIVDSYGVPLSWDKFALKIGLQRPVVAVSEY